MHSEISKLSSVARRALARRDWPTVDDSAGRILQLDEDSAEGWFLRGLALKASTKPALATQAFERALALDPARYDAAIELASQHSSARRNAAAAELIARYESLLSNSPMYLDMAGTVYTEIGMPERAWPLYVKANKLQPGVDLFMANMAACGVYLGKIEEARDIYRRLLERNPDHQRNHYHLSRLAKATDDAHVREMKSVLERTRLPEDRNVFLFYALGKELEDLGRWDEAFDYYRRAGDAVATVARYDIGGDIALIDQVIESCNRDWLQDGAVGDASIYPPATPVFVVGLPRTGTTLVERILSSHSRVGTLGETQFMQMAVRRVSGVASQEMVNAEIVAAAARKDIREIGRMYLDAVAYRLGPEAFFIDKLPYNFLYLGFIAKAYPHAKIVHLLRNPIDTCFAMYKQVFTWAYKFSYTLDGLSRYYVAYDRLCRHWRELLGDRLLEVRYEALVSGQEAQTRALLDSLGLEFERACLEFDRNEAATTTASSVQVREKIHTRSIEHWRNFAEQLEPLRRHLEQHDIAVS